MFITGTVILCLRLFCCAALIGETTKEENFSRGTDRVEIDSTELLWLQRGNQVIADQNSNAYAMIEGSNDLPKLPKYTTSVRVERRVFPVLAFPTVLATIIRYITQFIGLRGIAAWIFVAHLGVMLVMTALRSALRMERLSDNDEHHRMICNVRRQKPVPDSGGLSQLTPKDEPRGGVRRPPIVGGLSGRDLRKGGTNCRHYQ
jgi:hypothetical protein